MYYHVERVIPSFMPKWSHYLEDEDLDETPRDNFQKIKKKSSHPDDMGRSTKKKPKPQRTDSSSTG